MGRKTAYSRWDCEEDLDITLEEQLNFGEGVDTSSQDFSEAPTNTTTFTHGTEGLIVSRWNSNPHRLVKRGVVYRACKNEGHISKLKVLGLTVFVLIIGFIGGYTIGTKNHNIVKTAPQVPVNIHESRKSLDMDGNSFSPEKVQLDDPNQLLHQMSKEDLSGFHHSAQLPYISVNKENILRNLKDITQDSHLAGTRRAKSMAMNIRDLWRSFGLSVRVEKNQVLLTRATAFSYVESISKNGSILFTTSEIGEDVNLSDSRPFMAFSPGEDFTGTLIYGRYGTAQDLQMLLSSGVPVNGSIALIRFGLLHPSKIASIAVKFGIKGLIFYTDPMEFGADFPLKAIRRSSLISAGLLYENQKSKKEQLVIPAHTISAKDAEQLLRFIKQAARCKKVPKSWQGGLRVSYCMGSSVAGHQAKVRMRIYNKFDTGPIFNVIASIPGSWESDRYIIIGCHHDSWSNGAASTGIGVSLLNEIARSFSSLMKTGYKIRRSILFVSWDADAFATVGVTRWVQEHFHEISKRAVAYIDLTRLIRGNETLVFHGSPLLWEVARKSVSRVKKMGESTNSSSQPSIHFSSVVSSDEPAFTLFGNLGVPFLRPCLSSMPKRPDYSLFHTSYDTFENFVKNVDSDFNQVEALGEIIGNVVLLLADSAVLPVNVEDYVIQIQSSFSQFMTEYQDDLSAANLSVAYLQAAMMRLEVIGDNFRTELYNRTVINYEKEILPPAPSPISLTCDARSRRILQHRIINDKLMEMDRAFLSSTSDSFKHQLLGFTHASDSFPRFLSHILLKSKPFETFFSALKRSLDCNKWKRKAHFRALSSSHKKRLRLTHSQEWKSESRDQEYNVDDLEEDATPDDYDIFDSKECNNWPIEASTKMSLLTKALDSASAVLQSPLLPEENVLRAMSKAEEV